MENGPFIDELYSSKWWFPIATLKNLEDLHVNQLSACLAQFPRSKWIESRQILDHEDTHLRHLIGDLDDITLKKIYDFLVPGDYILDARCCLNMGDIAV